MVNGDGDVLLQEAGKDSAPSPVDCIGIAPVRVLEFSPDAESLACAHDDGSLTMLSVGTSAGSTVSACISHALPHSTASPVTSLAFRDPETLAVARSSGEVEVWDLLRLQKLFAFPEPLPGTAKVTLQARDDDSLVCFSETSACILQLGQ